MPADWRPVADIEALRLRATVNRTIREFFDALGVLEVETPLLSCSGNTDPSIESLVVLPDSGDTHDGAAQTTSSQRFLRTSPEYPLKRLLAAGVGDCYELGRAFRAGEQGRRHNPEFTLLEWYRLGFDHLQLAEEAAQLVLHVLERHGRPATLRRSSYRQLFQATLDIDPLVDDEARLRVALEAHNVQAQDLRRDDWLDLLLTHRIQPGFDADALHIVYDFPASQCALAQLRPGDPPLAERFELFLGPLELANGYRELRDAAEQRARFGADLQLRASRGQPARPIDERLLGALEAGLPACAGVALGVDRLLMHLSRTDDIAHVLAFPAPTA